MGTNYYVRTDICKCCSRGEEEIHIGKSSMGWSFTFHATDDIRSYKQWVSFLTLNSRAIFDEYGDNVTLDYFIEMVNNKKDAKFNHADEAGNQSFKDEEGHSFSPYEFS